jgi:hypothetical protein
VQKSQVIMGIIEAGHHSFAFRSIFFVLTVVSFVTAALLPTAMILVAFDS